MGGSRRKLKRDKPKVKVGGVKKDKTRKAQLPAELLAQHPDIERKLHKKADWDEGRSVVTNYGRNGLLLDPNQGFGRNQAPEPLVSLEARTAAGEETFEDDDELRALNGLERKTGRAAPPRLTGHQTAIIAKLLEAHGDDTAAMVLDRKLNKMQHSEGKLKLLITAHRHWAGFEGNARHDFRAPFKPYKRL